MSNYQTTPLAASEHVDKRAKRCNLDLAVGQSSCASQELPKAVVMTLDQGSLVTSMDFHPLQYTLLLVGTNIGELSIWDLDSKNKIVENHFKLLNDRVLSIPLKNSLKIDYTASVTRVAWRHDGILLGGAYSKNIVQIYSYHGDGDMQLRLEIEAHQGSVNDLAFSNTNFLVTCGDDKLIKVWNLRGKIQIVYKGNYEAPAHSPCHCFNENNKFGFSTAVDGKIKLWSYLFSRVDYNEQHFSSCRMAYSSHSARLFLSGRNNNGSPFLVEWNESDGTVKHTYHGLVMQAATTREVVNFDTLNDRFIVVGNEYMVKVWEMDNANLWTTIDVEGLLPASPCVKFNQQGTLLGVSTLDNGIKVLSNTDGIKILKMNENRSGASKFKLFGKTIITNTPPV